MIWLVLILFSSYFFFFLTTGSIIGSQFIDEIRFFPKVEYVGNHGQGFYHFSGNKFDFKVSLLTATATSTGSTVNLEDNSTSWTSILQIPYWIFDKQVCGKVRGPDDFGVVRIKFNKNVNGLSSLDVGKKNKSCIPFIVDQEKRFDFNNTQIEVGSINDLAMQHLEDIGPAPFGTLTNEQAEDLYTFKLVLRVSPEHPFWIIVIAIFLSMSFLSLFIDQISNIQKIAYFCKRKRKKNAGGN